MVHRTASDPSVLVGGQGLVPQARVCRSTTMTHNSEQKEHVRTILDLDRSDWDRMTGLDRSGAGRTKVRPVWDGAGGRPREATFYSIF